MISVGVRLAAFNLKQIANLTCTDELDLYSIGEKKVALFCCIPDADTSMNYLVGMIYSNLFQTLYYVADRKYGGRLPIPVHCIMDEWPNVALPDDFDKILATMRSRGISCSIIIQNIAQMKALFKDSYESLIGNCDEFYIWVEMKKKDISMSRNYWEKKHWIPIPTDRQKGVAAAIR